MSCRVNDANFLIDEQSFTWLFNTYWEKVYLICYHHIVTHENAQELTQNIFKSIWERRDQILIKGDVGHYVMRAAKLQVINYYRDNKVRKDHLNSFYQTYCESDYCTENDILFNQLNQKVHLLVDKLPCQCKIVYQLSKDKHLSNKEIAATLNISIKTVEYHLSNASKLLKNNLKEFI